MYLVPSIDLKYNYYSFLLLSLQIVTDNKSFKNSIKSEYILYIRKNKIKSIILLKLI